MRHSARVRKSGFALVLGLGWFAALAMLSAAPTRSLAEPPRPSKTGKSSKDAKPKPRPPAGKSRSDESNERVKEPATFSEAFDRAYQSLDEAQAASVGLKIARDQKTIDQEVLTRLEGDKVKGEQAAMDNFRLALSLAGRGPVKDRPSDHELNTARYYLCFLCYEMGEYYDAAVLGDFLAHHAAAKPADGDAPGGKPDDSPAAGPGDGKNIAAEVMRREGAKIALTSYMKLYSDSKQADKSFEAARIRDTAEYMLKHWPAEAEAEDAALALLNFAIADRRLDDAMGYLEKIPANSPRRGQWELYAGQVLWEAYLRAVRAPADQRPSQEELDRYKTQARKLLKQGVERIQQGADPNPTIASAMLALAQLDLETGAGATAITTLEDPKFGPLTLVEAGGSLAKQPGFAVETYKVAVRAYMGNHQVEKAKTVMDALDKAVVASGDPNAEKMLTEIYISLGRELQQQMDRLRKEGSKVELKAVSEAFETFLARIGSRTTGTDVGSLSWAAESAYGLANSLDDSSGPADDRAKTYYKQAATAYQQILAQAAKDPQAFPDPEVLIGIRLRTAVSLRRLGQYDDAIKLIVDVLKQRHTMLTAQVAGAETLAAQGEVDRNGYLKAIQGDMSDRQGDNLIWGWGRIAKATQGSSKFEETFYHARLKLAEARYLFAMKWTEADKREKIFNQAKNDLWLTFKLYPALGGPESADKYDILLKKIQMQLHQPIIGLREFKERDAAGKDPNQKSEAARRAGEKRSGLVRPAANPLAQGSCSRANRVRSING